MKPLTPSLMTAILALIATTSIASDKTSLPLSPSLSVNSAANHQLNLSFGGLFNLAQSNLGYRVTNKSGYYLESDLGISLYFSDQSYGSFNDSEVSQIEEYMLMPALTLGKRYRFYEKFELAASAGIGYVYCSLGGSWAGAALNASASYQMFESISVAAQVRGNVGSDGYFMPMLTLEYKL